MTPPPFVVVVDTREQTPLDFGEWPTVRGTLASGDYSIQGFEGVVALERKSLPDLIACIGRERDRFQRELERLAGFDYPALIIEATLAEVLAGYERSMVSGRAAIGSLLAWSVDFRLPVFFCGNRQLAAATVLKLLKKWFKARVAEPARLRGFSKL